MMMKKPPATYQEWINCLQKIAKEPVNKEDMLLIEYGKMPDGGYIPEKFQQRVIQAVDQMLKKYVKRFQDNLKEVMETGDYQSVSFLCRRLQREMEYCYFFQHMLFLEKTFVSNLQQEVDEQIYIFWGKVLCEMERIYKEAFYAGLEDVIYTLKRIYRK